MQEDGDSLDSSDGFSSQDEGESSPTGAGYARRITGQRKASSEKPLGVTLNGIRVFPIPELHDARYRLLHKCYSLPSLATWIGLLVSLVAAGGLAQWYWRADRLVLSQFTFSLLSCCCCSPPSGASAAT